MIRTKQSPVESMQIRVGDHFIQRHNGSTEKLRRRQPSQKTQEYFKQFKRPKGRLNEDIFVIKYILKSWDEWEIESTENNPRWMQGCDAKDIDFSQLVRSLKDVTPIPLEKLLVKFEGMYRNSNVLGDLKKYVYDDYDEVLEKPEILLVKPKWGIEFCKSPETDQASAFIPKNETLQYVLSCSQIAINAETGKFMRSII